MRRGINRLTAGRLSGIAQLLGVEASYFYEGLQTPRGFLPPPQGMLPDLARNYLNIPVREHREAIVALTQALAERDNGAEPAP